MSLSHKQTIAIHKWLLWGCFCGVCRPLYINMSPDKISIDIYYQISLHSKQYNLGFWNSFAMFFFLVGYPDQMKDHIAYIEGIWISLHVLLIPQTCFYDERYGISILNIYTISRMLTGIRVMYIVESDIIHQFFFLSLFSSGKWLNNM